MDRPTTRQQLERLIEYKPLPSQRRFHDSVARFKGFSGPIGSGKSQALCNEAIRLAYVNQGRAGLIGAPTYPMLRDATQTALFRVLNENKIPYEFNKAENQLRFVDTDSTVLFRSLDDHERLRGTNLAWFGVDELSYTSEEAWLRLEGRLRDPQASKLCGFGVWTPKGYDWVWRRFIEKPVEGYDCIRARPYENQYLLEAVPDFYDRLKASYSGSFFAQEVMGEYVGITEGRVYHAFDRKRHVREMAVDPALPLRWALDFNVNPMCSVVCQIVGNEVRVLDEIEIARASTMDACVEFRRRYPDARAGIVVYADASGARMQSLGGSDVDVIQEFVSRKVHSRVEFRIPRSNPPVRARVELVNQKLRSADDWTTLYVAPRCYGLIADFESVAYVENSMDIDKGRDPKRTHLSDALGYLIWEENNRDRQQFGFKSDRLL